MDCVNVDINNLNLLSNIGSEVVVYNDSDTVYKIYKEDYKLEHKDPEDIKFLSDIVTKRILMPKGLIVKDNQVIGYTMQYISGKKNILDITIEELLKELEIIEEDIEILSNCKVRLIDINRNNCVFNGCLYLVDPGNYYINDLSDLYNYLFDLGYSNLDIIRQWNYDKVNKLLHELLFMKNQNVDLYMLRKIIEFFNKVKEDKGLLYDYYIYDKYFNHKLTVREAIIDFINNNIIIDLDEKNKIMSLFYGKNKL